MVNYLEYEKFKPGYAAANFINEVVMELQAGAVPNSPKKLTYFSGHYTTFVNFFGLTGLSSANTSLQAIPDYGSLLVFELLANPNDTTSRYVRFSYRNGQSAPQVFAIPGLPEIAPLADFVNKMKPLAASGLKGWCNVCGNTINRGCEALGTSDVVSTATSSENTGMKPVVGGVIGAAVGVLVTALIAGVVWRLRAAKKSHPNNSGSSSDFSGE
ncbi:hypothetical protein HK104_002072 [Borealophlyctis nickersoniae]|nr:hypothetical protein HK104_002072 [Borealophlyctis nickersoniae]